MGGGDDGLHPCRANQPTITLADSVHPPSAWCSRVHTIAGLMTGSKPDVEEPDVRGRFISDPGRWAVVAAVSLTMLGVLSMLSPRLIFTPTLPTSGDLGAHIFPLHEFANRLVPSGAIAGWTHGWFTGMPLFFFYFPLPAVIVAALAPLAGFAVAVKIMVAVGPLTLPPAAYLMLRSTGMSRWQAGAGSVVGSMFLLMSSYSIYGGNLLSTYIGEFAYSISFTFSLLYLAVVLKAGRTGKAAPVAAAVLLSLTALSHTLTAAAVVAVTVPLIFEERYGRTVVSSWVLGFLLSGFWAFPFLARLPFSTGPWHLYDPSMSELVPVELWIFLPIAAFGAWRAGKDLGAAAIPLLLLPVVALAFYIIPHEVAHRMRLMPYAFLMVHAFAGVGIGSALQSVVEQRSRLMIAALTVAVWAVVGLNVARNPGVVRERVATAMAGYENAPEWTEYEQIVDAVSQLPPGRLFWEESTRVNDYGSTRALMIMPYWSEDHPVLSGLWLNSSLTYPFDLRVGHELGDSAALTGDRFRLDRDFDFDRGIDHARTLGGRYFLAFSDTVRGLADRHPGLSRVVDGGDWSVHEVEGVNLVTTSTQTPVVYPGRSFTDVAIRWFDSVPNFEPWVVAEGPAEWPRVEADLVGLSESPQLDAGRVTITDVEFGPERISFKTDGVGVPHLVRASFFPNWISVGADGPYRAAPSAMVVVPTTEEVNLVFVDSWVEWVGRGLTIAGLLWAMLIVGRGDGPRRPRRRRRGSTQLPSYGRRR